MRFQAAIMIMAFLGGCASTALPLETPLTREEIVAEVNCATLANGVDCACVIDKSLASEAEIRTTMSKLIVPGASSPSLITRHTLVYLAVDEGIAACSPAKGVQ